MGTLSFPTPNWGIRRLGMADSMGDSGIDGDA
jgi:hypothetical protein